MENIQEIETIYKDYINNPLNIIGDMTYDEYCDWLDLGDREDLKATLKKFIKSKVPKDYIDILKIKLGRL